MKNKKIAIILISTLLILISLNAFAKSRYNKKDYFPLSVGNEWEYSALNLDYQLNYKITKKAKIGKYICYKLKTNEKKNRIQGTDYFTKINGNTCLIAYKNKYTLKTYQYKKPVLCIPKNVKIGKTWKLKRVINTGRNVKETRKVINFETISVPAGKFKALHIYSATKVEGAPMEVHRWYTEGIGLIKWQVTQNKNKATFVLKQYKVKKGK